MKSPSAWGAAWLLLVFLLAPVPALAQDASAAREAAERQRIQPLNNAPVWREVRKEGQQHYTSIPGREAGVLIQTYGETWRQLRNGPITFYGGWLVVLVLVALGLFYLWKGPIRLHEPPTGRLLERFTVVERAAHWSLAITFCVLGITGLIILFGKYVVLPVIGYTLFAWLTQASKHLHNFVGPVFILSLVIVFVVFVRDNLWRSYDWRWFARFGGLLTGKHVPSGRFNAGEKSWFWVGTVVLGTIVSVSGLVLNFPNFEQTRDVMIEANIVHAIAAILFIVLSFAHIYLGTVGMEGAYGSMRHGYVDEAWAREHHEYWYQEVKSGKPGAEAAGASPQVQH